jgi:hypothetical protein
MACLAMISDATDFDPQRKRIPKDVFILWDYGIHSDVHPNNVSLIDDGDLDHLASNVLATVGLPKRFITEKQWQIYNKLATASGIKLKPIFVPAGNKRIKTSSNHFLKIKDLVMLELLNNGEPQAFDEGGNPIKSIKELNGDSLIHASIFNAYLQKNNGLLGDPPSQHLVRGNKMISQENEILGLIKEMGLDPKKLPRKPENSPYSSRLTIRANALQNHELFPTKAVFHQSWYRLTKKGEIHYSEEA